MLNILISLPVLFSSYALWKTSNPIPLVSYAFMSTLTIKLPDATLKSIRQLARKEGMTVNQFMSSAAGEKLAAWQTVGFLKKEAAQGRRKDYLKFLQAVPEGAVPETDRIG